MYQLMAGLTSKMSALTIAQAQSDETTRNLDECQNQLSSQQAELIEIIKSLASNI